MLISVIVPIYNVEQYLPECIESIRSQSYENLEIILVDDGSTDRCPQLCDDYAQRDPRIRVIHKPNGGQSDARNHGLRVATGEYVLFIDSDDYWDDSDSVRQLVDRLQASPDADLVFFRYKIITHDKVFESAPIDLDRVNGKDKLSVLEFFSAQGDLSTSPWSKLIRRSLLTENGIEFEKNLLSEDLDWSLKLYLRASKFYAIDNPFYAYRRRPGSTTTMMKRKSFIDLLRVIDKWRIAIPREPIPEREKRIYMGFLCYQYSILMGLLYRADKATAKEVKKRLKELSYLLRYDVSFKTHRVAVMYRLFGFEVTCWLLQQYIKHRPKTFA